jgi:two-component system NtrC family sensor kinase
VRRLFSWWTRLRFRVALAFVVLSTAPLVVVGTFAVQTADDVVAGIAANQLENMAAEKQDLLERWLAERKADVGMLAGSPVLRDGTPQRIAEFLQLVQRQYGVYDRLLAASADGKTRYDTAGPAGVSCRRQPWFPATQRGDAYMSDVRFGSDERKSVFLIAEPIRGGDGKPAGAVCATVATSLIVTGVLRLSLGETGECYLVDRHGTFLAHKEPQWILRESIAPSGSFAQLFGRRRSGTVYTDYRGVPVLGASRPVLGTPWYVVVEQDWDEAMAGSRRLVWKIVVAVLATAAAAVGLSWLAASYLTAPISTLSEAAAAVARGDYSGAADSGSPTRSDELGALETSFRGMARELWDRELRLQNRIGVTEDELRKSEAKLRQTFEAAARSEHLAALGRLAAGVAHEIRTPLTSLKLYLQSARDEVTHSPELVEDFDVAMRQIRRIESTINHFLDFSRPQERSMAPLDFARLVDDSLEVVTPRANQQDVEVHRSVSGDLPAVEGDSRQLGESLVNLLVNALEVMPDGGRLSIVVRVDGPAAARGKPFVLVEVLDTGPGIAPGDRDRIFEPFFTTKATGSGLGLAIVRRTVDRHGGRITVHSAPEVGSRFSILLRPSGIAEAQRHPSDDGTAST